MRNLTDQKNEWIDSTLTNVLHKKIKSPQHSFLNIIYAANITIRPHHQHCTARCWRRLQLMHVMTVRGPVTTTNPAKMAGGTEMPLRGQTRVGPRHHVLAEGTHGRHLANTTKQSVLGEDASCH